MFRRVHVEPRKDKESGGINFVLQSYARLVKGLVRRYPQEARGLVVVVDGDSVGLKQRLRELDQRLEEVGGAKRDAAEKIAACVPCRTVETWELWLCGRHDLNESDDYKVIFQSERRKGNASAGGAVKAWFDHPSEASKNTEDNRLPSLEAGRAELDRLYSLAGKG
jgi:hypothetical protein